jgi:hypothetical protein
LTLALTQELRLPIGVSYQEESQSKALAGCLIGRLPIDLYGENIARFTAENRISIPHE